MRKRERVRRIDHKGEEKKALVATSSVARSGVGIAPEKTGTGKDLYTKHPCTTEKEREVALYGTGFEASFFSPERYVPREEKEMGTRKWPFSYFSLSLSLSRRGILFLPSLQTWTNGTVHADKISVSATNAR